MAFPIESHRVKLFIVAINRIAKQRDNRKTETPFARRERLL